MIESVLIGFLVISAIAIISLVLLQHGKGADIGAAVGSGASNTVFGSQGSVSFLVKLTFALVAVFFIVCISLTIMARQAAKGEVKIRVPQYQIAAPASNTAVPMIPRTTQPKQ